MVNEGKTPFEKLLDENPGKSKDTVINALKIQRKDLYNNVLKEINKPIKDIGEIRNKKKILSDFVMTYSDQLRVDGYSDDSIYDDNFYNNKPGGKRKSRRNRKSKKGKKSRKARKSRRKSNRRRR